MFFIRFYHFIFGYITVKIIGAKPERFINMLMNMRIKFWGIEKAPDGLRVKISSRYMKKALFDEISRKTNTEYKIISQKGVRFFLERRKRRLGIYAGTVIGVLLIYFSTFLILKP